MVEPVVRLGVEMRFDVELNGEDMLFVVNVQGDLCALL